MQCGPGCTSLVQPLENSCTLPAVGTTAVFSPAQQTAQPILCKFQGESAVCKAAPANIFGKVAAATGNSGLALSVKEKRVT